MHSRRIILATILVTSLLTAGCLRDVIREVSKDVSGVKALHDGLVKKFGDAAYVNINRNGETQVLNVTFINSPLNDKAKEDRASRAQETANLVRFNYSNSRNLTAIWVVFVREKKTFLFVTERRWVDYFGFDREARKLPAELRTTGSYGVELRTATTYISSDNETDISVSGILLDGVAGGNGVTLLPHFRVKGDVKSAKAAPPKEVSFDFASYSDKPEFGTTVPVVFTADGERVVKTTATPARSTYSGTVTEFIYLKIPYAAFLKITAANQVTMKVGAKEFYLEASQRNALRDMSDYLTE